MPKYLSTGTLTNDGVKSLLEYGGSKRRKIIEELLTTVGARLDAYYYTFGKTDTVLIIDAPDNVTMTKLSLMFNANGIVEAKTTVLITPEEVDKAAGRA